MKTIFLTILWLSVLAGCGSADCHFEYDLRGNGAQYSVCKDGSRVKL